MDGKKSVRDMVLSLSVILLGAGLLYLTVPNEIFTDEDERASVREVSYRAELATAGRAAPYTLLAPAGLDEGWRATSVYYRAQSDHGAVWHLGFLDPDTEYAAVEQSDGPAEKFVAEVTHRAEPTGETSAVDGEEWARYEGPKYDALVRSGPGVTTVVAGTAPFERLAELAAALEPGQPDPAAQEQAARDEQAARADDGARAAGQG
ncbi:DUF4245 domain-containing protein [Streptomyces sp. TRM 70351]|uniref:DUF4245 domain-containing protein n=1 Tax=Streptomyces sp. TRM 70351 TaxID=3116552 RepID=UPI002E7C3B0D|nr:DUF4245 domain-containing protein [Streptomyces sp. TRM 70351]MEE1927769.1 DUF4245 domain-containing protein [Streptomyces sp. TRM 70351]